MNITARRLLTAAAMPVLVAGALVATSAQANAAGVSPHGIVCTAEESVETTNTGSNYMIPLSSQEYKDGPGGTISVSVTKSGSVSATATVSTGITVSDIISSAKIDISASITKSTSITVGHTYSHNISAKKYGHAEYGSWGYTISWEDVQTRSNCTSTVLSSGTGKMTTNSVGWKYWETAS
jgi:hypothetical protein